MLIAIDISQLIRILTNNNKNNSRAIQSSTPKQISLYKKIVYEKMSTKEIKNTLNQINDKLQHNTLTETDILTINDIDSYFTKIQLDAEKAIKNKTSLTT